MSFQKRRNLIKIGSFSFHEDRSLINGSQICDAIPGFALESRCIRLMEAFDTKG